MVGDIKRVLNSKAVKELEGEVSLIFTSPPFPLTRQKRYGAPKSAGFSKWLSSLAPRFARMLKPDGSIVIEMGNAWEPGKPVMSLVPLQSLISFVNRGKLFINQQFVLDNPARLPGPAEWVNRQRIRVKDSYTHVWWMSRSERPKADNRKVLRPYSDSMEKLLKIQKYNAGARPSEHVVNPESFLVNHGGAIPSSLLESETSSLLSASNTSSSDKYLRACRELGIKPHPARMPGSLPKFFIEMLTEPDDLIFDPFAGSNTTGYVAESLKRRWVSAELDTLHAAASSTRFDKPHLFPSAISALASWKSDTA